MNKLLIDSLCNMALKSYEDGEIPVAAAVVDQDFNVVSLCGNSRQYRNNVINHAEILSIIEAENVIGDWRLNGYYLVTTLYPCDMCSAVIDEARLDRVFYLLDKPNNNIVKENYILVDGYDFEKEKLRKLLTSFFDNIR